MAKQAKPFQEGIGWAMRRRVHGQDLYVSGRRTATQAREEMERLVSELKKRGAPKALGPRQTTVAQSLQDYGRERLPFLKGADQEARRINTYLRAAGLATLKATKLPSGQGEEGRGADLSNTSGKGRRYFTIELEPLKAERKVPQGLGAHRRDQAGETAKADALRAAIARKCVAQVQPYDAQKLMDALREVRQAATVQLERALLRTFFNHAFHVWRWSEPSSNPCVRLKMPKVDNNRERVMSLDEQQRLDAALDECRNALVGPTLALLRETAMRTGEPLEYACWKDVDWKAHVIRLGDSKNDKRNVPLSPAAEEALRDLARLNSPEPDERIVQMSYNALAAAWRRACERAGLEDLHIHDLRHTAATRMMLKTGNLALVKALTGHKTWSQVGRYVNVSANDVVAVMHAPEPSSTGPSLAAVTETEPLVDTVGNLVVGAFKRRAA